MNNETDCDLHSFAGRIICVSDQSETMGAKLTTDEVKARVIKSNSELDLIHFLEEIPQFYKFKSSIFTNLGK